MKHAKKIISWILSLWIAKTFLISLTYKFTGSSVTVYIFGTIGEWMKGFLGETLGQLFIDYGAWKIGVFELLVSLILLLPGLLWILAQIKLLKSAPDSDSFHSLGGILSSAVMAGAIFFHLFSPLGIEVFYSGKGDGGSLFYTSIQIFIYGLVLFFLNGRKLKLRLQK